MNISKITPLSVALKRVEIRGLHGSQNVDADLHPGLNIIHGRNGIGKTTFLHIIANLVERDIERFTRFHFTSIKVSTYGGNVIQLSKDTSGAKILVLVNGGLIGEVGVNGSTPSNIDKTLAETLGGRPVYLPAFRSILEAISDMPRTSVVGNEREAEIKRIFEAEEKHITQDIKLGRIQRLGYATREFAQSVAQKTSLCREWFGTFVPTVRFPALNEVANQIFEEFRQAQVEVGATDRQAFSATFVRVLKVIMGGNDGIQTQSQTDLLKSIESSLNNLQQSKDVSKVYNEISQVVKSSQLSQSEEREMASKVLSLYDQSLRDRVSAEKRAFERIRTFEESVNRFLEGKKLQVHAESDETIYYRRRYPRSRMVSFDNGRRESLSVLSSGERHVLTLLFSATHMSPSEGILLIDEPELSLHVDWQRIILAEIMKQAGERQIITCTHAPEVTADHRECLKSLTAVSTDDRDIDLDFLIDLDE